MAATCFQTSVSKLESLAPGHVLVRLTWEEQEEVPCLCAGQHLKLFAPNPEGEAAGQWCGKPDPEHGDVEICRRYTPIACNMSERWFDVVVELITKKRAPPDGGKFSRHIESLSVGDPVKASGPHGLYRHLGARRFGRGGGAGEGEVAEASEVVLVAAGVASNTALNLARAVAALPEEEAPRLWILLTARTREAVLHREAFESLAGEGRGAIRVWFSIEKGEAPEAWPYGLGGFSKALSGERLPAPGEGALVISMGAPRTKALCEELLPALGHGATPVWHWNAELD